MLGMLIFRDGGSIYSPQPHSLMHDASQNFFLVLHPQVVCTRAIARVLRLLGGTHPVEIQRKNMHKWTSRGFPRKCTDN
jgi:hypothetical protein